MTPISRGSDHTLFGGTSFAEPTDFTQQGLGARYAGLDMSPIYPSKLESAESDGLARFAQDVSRRATIDNIKQETELQERISEPGSILEYTYGYNDTVDRIANLIQTDTKNFVEAESLYRKLQEVSRENASDLKTISSYRKSGDTAAVLRDNASKLASGAFNMRDVTLSDGTKTTLGQLFGGSGYMANRSQHLARLGLDPEVTEAYLGEDPFKARLVGYCVAPMMAAAHEVQSYPVGVADQFAFFPTAATYIARMSDNLRDKLGETATETLVQYAIASRRTSGGIPDFIDAVYQKALRNPADVREDSRRWVQDIIQLDADLKTAATGTSGTEYSPRDAQSRLHTLTMATSILDAGLDAVDLHSPLVRASVVRLATEFSKAKYNDDDLFTMLVDAGKNPKNAIRQYIYDSVHGGVPGGTNVIKQAEDLRVYTHQLFKSAPTVAESVQSVAGNINAMKQDAAKAVGARSTSPDADAMQARLEGAIWKHVFSAAIRNGLNNSDAFLSIAVDPERAKVMISDMTEAIMASGLSGTSASNSLASDLAKLVFQSITVNKTGKPFSISDQLGSLALTKITDDMSPEAAARVRAARAWYLQNISMSDQFMKQKERIARHMTMFDDIPVDAARTAAASYTQMAAEMLADNNEAALEYMDAPLDQGTVYIPTKWWDIKRQKLYREWAPGYSIIDTIDTRMRLTGNVGIANKDGQDFLVVKDGDTIKGGPSGIKPEEVKWWSPGDIDVQTRITALNHEMKAIAIKAQGAANAAYKKRMSENKD